MNVIWSDSDSESGSSNDGVVAFTASVQDFATNDNECDSQVEVEDDEDEDIYEKYDVLFEESMKTKKKNMTLSKRIKELNEEKTNLEKKLDFFLTASRNEKINSLQKELMEQVKLVDLMSEEKERISKELQSLLAIFHFHALLLKMTFSYIFNWVHDVCEVFWLQTLTSFSQETIGPLYDAYHTL